jgi:hypothetical protein
MNGPREIAASEMCDRVKHLGYAAGSQIHVYGERLDVVSDPFPHDKGIAVRVRAENGASIRIIKLPSTVLQAVKKSVMPLGHR